MNLKTECFQQGRRWSTDPATTKDVLAKLKSKNKNRSTTQYLSALMLFQLKDDGLSEESLRNN